MTLTNGIIIAAPTSGSGKTLVTTGLAGALMKRGMRVVTAKAGPDYIDPCFHALATGMPAVNLDAWAMSPQQLRYRVARAARGADFLLIEGVMGLFDGAFSGKGSTADLAALLNLPVLLVVDATAMAQSVAAVAHGFSTLRDDIDVAGIILNRVAGARHEAMLLSALAAVGVACIGTLERDPDMRVPARHLGLVLPEDFDASNQVVHAVTGHVCDRLDIDRICALSRPLTPCHTRSVLAPPGQVTAVARDRAFAFIYPHLLADWRESGAEIRFFSPLADEAPDERADAVFLPGGYPELHVECLAAAQNFRAGMSKAAAKGVLIYGECGGYMALGRSITDKFGKTGRMLGLLPHTTAMNRPHRRLGYRQLTHDSPLPWPRRLLGHEYHYSSRSGRVDRHLFDAVDAANIVQAPMGSIVGNVMGSYAHIIDQHTGM